MLKTAIVTLTYNKLELATKPFLESLYKYTLSELFDLVIVDNGSNDGTVEYIKDFKKNRTNITLIENKKNLGYSRGNNIGIKSVMDKDYEYIALLNNDILFTPNWLVDTIEGFKIDEQIGILSPRSSEKTGLTANNYLKKYKKFLSKLKTELKYVLKPFFSCVLIKKEVFKKIGLFDEAYTPAFWEDDDLSIRAMYAGYSCAYLNSVFIFHNRSTTSSFVKNEIIKRNKEYFCKKHPLGRYFVENKRTNIINDIIKYINNGHYYS